MAIPVTPEWLNSQRVSRSATFAKCTSVRSMSHSLFSPQYRLLERHRPEASIGQCRRILAAQLDFAPSGLVGGRDQVLDLYWPAACKLNSRAWELNPRARELNSHGWDRNSHAWDLDSHGREPNSHRWDLNPQAGELDSHGRECNSHVWDLKPSGDAAGHVCPARETASSRQGDYLVPLGRQLRSSRDNFVPLERRRLRL